MKLIRLTYLFLYSASTLATRAYRGFNMRNFMPNATLGSNGPPKYKSDWDFSFQRLKNMTGNYNSVRLYSVTDSVDGTNHNWLMDVLPSAKDNDMLILVGMFLNDQGDGSRFGIEFDALKAAVAQHGTDQIIGISVGNEDLYGNAGANYSTPEKIAGHITAVKQWTSTLNDCIPVGHTDTWGTLVESASQPMLQASDFMIANLFPFWEKNVNISNAKNHLEYALVQVQNTSIINGNIDWWIGETGWATQSVNVATPGIASVANAQQYWNEIVCGGMLETLNSFYYIDTDVGQNPEFGVFDINGKAKINLICPQTGSQPAAASSSSVSRRWNPRLNRRQAAASSSGARTSCPVKTTTGALQSSSAPSTPPSSASSIQSFSTSSTQPLSASSIRSSSAYSIPLPSTSSNRTTSASPTLSSTTSSAETLSVSSTRLSPAYPTVESSVGTNNTTIPSCTRTTVLQTSFVTQTVLVTVTEPSAMMSSAVLSSTEPSINMSSSGSQVSPSFTTTMRTTETSIATNWVSSPAAVSSTTVPLTSSEGSGSATEPAVVTTTQTQISTTDMVMSNGTSGTLSTSSSSQANASSSYGAASSDTSTPSLSSTSAQLSTTSDSSMSPSQAAATTSSGSTSTSDQAAASSSSAPSSGSDQAAATTSSDPTSTASDQAAASTSPATTTSIESSVAAVLGWDPRRVATFCDGDAVGVCAFADSSQYYATATPLPSGWWPSSLDGS